MQRVGRVLVTSAVLLALMAPVLSPLAGADLWGWLPGHGHATLGGVVAEHTHAWDAEAPSGLGASRDAAGGDLAFTAGDLLGAPAIPVGTVALLVIPLLVGRLVRTPRPARLLAPSFAPEPPPPR